MSSKKVALFCLVLCSVALIIWRRPVMNFFFPNHAFIQQDDTIKTMVIIGGGPAALSAAVYAARAKFNPVVIEGEEPGGQLAKASLIQNWPGTELIEGVQLVNNIKEQAKKLGATFIQSSVTSISTKPPYLVELANKDTIKANSIVIATGATPAPLGCPGEKEFLGKGVAVCAACDAPFFENKKVVVIGGGYGALQEIGVLLKYTKDITVVHMGEKLKGPEMLLQYVKSNPHVKILHGTKAIAIEGNQEKVDHVVIEDLATHQTRSLPADGVFIAVGWRPSTDFLRGKLYLNNKHQIVINHNTKTSIPGIFAAGDCTNNSYHQSIVAAAFGYMCSMDAENYLRDKGIIT